MVDSSNQPQARVGIEISRTGLNAVAIGDDGALIAERRVSVADEDKFYSELLTLINGIEREYSFKRIGMAVPGLVDTKTGRVAFSANIPRHADVDLVSDVRSGTGLDVVIENDANAAAYGEFRLGAGRGCRDMFYATLGKGVGGALIFDGKIWRGASGFAGEFGYMTINSEGMRLEDVASSDNIIRRTRGRFNRDSTSSLGRLAEEQIGLDEIIAAAERDDDFAQLMLERTGTHVGTAIASVINLVNVERIIVGGEIMQAKHVVLDAIITQARELSFEPSFAATEILAGELGLNAAAIGAAFLSGE